MFSGIIPRKDKKEINKKLDDINNRLNNHCSQKNLDYINNTNLQEEYLGIKNYIWINEGILLLQVICQNI